MHALERTQHLTRDVDGDADRKQLVVLAQPPEEAVAVDAVDVRQVGTAAGREVVDHPDGVSATPEFLCEMRRLEINMSITLLLKIG